MLRTNDRPTSEWRYNGPTERPNWPSGEILIIQRRLNSFVQTVHLVRVYPYPYPFWVYPVFSYPNTHTHTHTHIFKIPIPIPIPISSIPKMGITLTIKHVSNSIKEAIESSQSAIATQKRSIDHYGSRDIRDRPMGR